MPSKKGKIFTDRTVPVQQNDFVIPTAGKMDDGTPGNSVIKYKMLKDLSAEQAIGWLRQAPMDGDILDDDGRSLPFCTFGGTNGTSKIEPFEYRWTAEYRDNPPVTLQTGSGEKKVLLSDAMAKLGKDAKYFLQDVRGKAPMANARANGKKQPMV